MDEEEEDQQPQLFSQFTKDCHRLGTFYFGFKGGKEKIKAKGKESDKGKEKEKEGEEKEENLDEEVEAEEVDLSVELQHQRRKALIQLIRNGITFLMEVPLFFVLLVNSSFAFFFSPFFSLNLPFNAEI